MSNTVIFLVDRSESVGRLPTPDTVEALIQHFVQVASLARTPTKLVVIVYNGDGIKVIGDAQGQPTLAYETLLEQLGQEFPRPNGTTPLVEALTTTVALVKRLSPDQSVTIIHCGDGQPCSPIDVDKYPAVAKYVSDRIAAVTQGVAADEQQAKIVELRRQWADPETADGKRLFELHFQEEFASCKRLVAGLRDRKVRFVSVDFNGVESLRELHESAGGARDDYLLVRPASRLIELLHERGLTRYDGVLVSKPIELKESNRERNIVEIPLDAIAEAAVITAVFQEPVANFADHLRLGFRVDGRTVELSSEGRDPTARLSYDNAGRVATATLVLPAIPSNHQVALACRRHGDTKLPSLTIYRHQRLKTSFQIVLRPLNSQPVDVPPFVVSPNQPVSWQTYLHDRETDAPVALTSIDVVLHESRQQSAQRLELVKDADREGLFKTPAAIQLATGQYDAETSVVLAGGGDPLVLRLAGHIHSQLGDERVTLEIDADTSASVGFIDAGELGDAIVDAAVKCRIRSDGVHYPMPVKLALVDLVDSQGTPLAADVVKPSQTELTLQPGQPSPFVVIRCKLPEHLGEVMDGPIEGRLAITRTDINAPVAIVPYKDSVDGGVPPNTVRFYLRRPALELSARRAGRDELKTQKEHFLWPIRADIWKPFQRAMELNVSHTSQIDREVSVVLSGPFRTTEGRTCPSVALLPTDDGELVRPIPAGKSAIWRYDLAIPADLPSEPISATLQVFGPGLRKCELPIVINLRRPLLAPSLRWVFAVLAYCLMAVAFTALVGTWQLRKYRRGGPVDIRTDGAFDFVRVQPGRRGEAILEFDGAGVTRRHRADAKARPAKPRETVAPDDVSNTNPLIFSRQDENGVFSLAIERIEMEPAGPVVLARVEEPGSYDQRRTHRARRFRRTALGAFVFGSLAIYVYHEHVVALLQWCSDALGGI